MYFVLEFMCVFWEVVFGFRNGEGWYFVVLVLEYKVFWYMVGFVVFFLDDNDDVNGDGIVWFFCC